MHTASILVSSPSGSEGERVLTPMNDEEDRSTCTFVLEEGEIEEDFDNGISDFLRDLIMEGSGS